MTYSQTILQIVVILWLASSSPGRRDLMVLWLGRGLPRLQHGCPSVWWLRTMSGEMRMELLRAVSVSVCEQMMAHKGVVLQTERVRRDGPSSGVGAADFRSKPTGFIQPEVHHQQEALVARIALWALLLCPEHGRRFFLVPQRETNLL